ncbi:MAG: prepilin-type cleavage/methylation domain-containing protein [Peptoniphilus harei]|uniref:prepilin-type cleavage/methylation domain-containing protein n=1 Tax=Peptoniphilus harei TaxID=54005 RepID=UPI0029053E6B|nr:prepilin-type cleavage/methylation domain-containing protein [Peptoniphilus harei]MDU2373240.1 prepilin-type cleavage/methylation domain-containing protein [Peptoniphilus harei]
MKRLRWRYTSKREAYSLIELVMSMAMLLIIGMVITSILGVSQKALTKTYENENISSDLSYALGYIKDEITSSDYYTVVGGKIYFIQPVENKFNYVSFGLKDNKVYRYSLLRDRLGKTEKIESDGVNALVENISSFSIDDEGDYFFLFFGYKDKEEIIRKIAKRSRLYE